MGYVKAGFTALENAILNNNVPIVTWLLAHGAKAHRKYDYLCFPVSVIVVVVVVVVVEATTIHAFH